MSNQHKKDNSQVNIAEIIKVRHNKLNTLKENESNPFINLSYDNTHDAQDIF